MDFLTFFIRILFWVFCTITLAGMIKPWWVLWFLDYKNRLMVLRYYGVITLLLGLALWILDRLNAMQSL